MKRLLLWSAVLTCVCSGFIALTSQLGKTTPPPEFANWFTNPNGTLCRMPCLFGIEAGITRFEDVEKILKSHQLLPHTYSVVHDPIYNTSSFHFYSSQGTSTDFTAERDSRGLVRMMHLSYPMKTNGNPLNFVDVLYVFGIPRAASLRYYNTYDTDIFIYRNETVFISVVAPQIACLFKAEDPVWYIHLYGEGVYEEIRQYPGAHGVPDSYAWAGFARETYWSRYYHLDGGQKAPCSP